MRGKDRVIPFNLQFFAGEGAADGGQQGQNNANGNIADTGIDNQSNFNNQSSQDNPADNLDDGQDQQQQKTFTQDELQRIASREKRQGRQAVLNSIGVKSEAELKKIVNAYNRFLSADNAQEAKEAQGNSDYDELQERVLLAESKLAALQLGVDKDCLDDAIAIANMKAKISGDDVSDVLEDMKKDRKYSGFFGPATATKKEEKSGTGTGVNHAGGTSVTGAELGKSIAQMAKQNRPAKSSYFKR